MLSAYSELLRVPGAWRFSLAGFVLRLPMSMMGISTILLVKASYGNYTLAGVVSAVAIISTAVVAPTLARLVDQWGQLKVMGPALAVSALSAVGLLIASAYRAPVPLVIVFAALGGATWGSPGALVRSRWAHAVAHQRQLTSAYALEAALDEFIFILGPVLSTVLGTVFHPGTGIALSAVFLGVGGVAFLAQRSSEPPPQPRATGVRSRSVILQPVVFVMALTYVGAGALFGANDVAVVEFTAARGAPALSGVLLAVFSFGSLLAALVYGARVWTMELWRLYAIGVVALGVGVTTFLVADSLWVMAGAMLLAGMACAPTMTNVNMIIAKVVPQARLTEGLTWMSTSMNLGVSVGSALAGPAVDEAGARGGYLVMVGAAWIMVALMVAGLGQLRRGTQDSSSRLPADS